VRSDIDKPSARLTSIRPGYAHNKLTGIGGDGVIAEKLGSALTVVESLKVPDTLHAGEET